MTTTIATGHLQDTIRRMFIPSDRNAEAAVRQMEARRYRAAGEAEQAQALIRTGAMGRPMV